MHAAEILPGLLSGTPSNLPGELPFSTLTPSSREVTPGTVFFAIPGTARDGHEFIDDAFSRGAALAVVERADTLKGRPGIVVSNARLALSRLAAFVEGYPAREMLVAGVTGTNGKTTTTWMIQNLWQAIRGPAVRIGTLGIAGSGELDGASLTTPDAVDLHRVFRSARKHGCTLAVLEASSHALDQERVSDAGFDCGVFSNLTRDHLDYHGTMERYFEAKAKLLDLVAGSGKPARVAAINIDGPFGLRMKAHATTLGLRDFSFGRNAGAALRITAERQLEEGVAFSIRYEGETFELAAPFAGAHNVENCAAAFAALVGLGVSPRELAERFPEIPQVPGRLESIRCDEVSVYVDFAHTPDALERAIHAVKSVARGRVWVVFGCGGDRDRGKRPEMGRIASGAADRIVVTSDNPRTEEPERIIDEIMEGIGSREAIRIADRRAAIAHALREASPGDAVLVAGKGHEDYQIIGTVKHSFSDQAVIRETWRTIMEARAS